jgi:hypothetical protein
MPALAELRRLILAGKVEISGWRCSWSPDGLAPRFRADRKRETIPALDVVDLVFDCLPDWEVVLVSQRFHSPRPDAPYTELHGYGDFLDVRIGGWEKLYLPADQVRAAYGEADDIARNVPRVDTPEARSETRRRGPRPEKRRAVAAAMLHKINAGETTLPALKEEKREALVVEYGVKSRDTISRALADVAEVLKQRQLDKRQIATDQTLLNTPAGFYPERKIPRWKIPMPRQQRRWPRTFYGARRRSRAS